MKRLVIAAVFVIAASFCLSNNVSAQQPCGAGGFLPFGFYQPYGARYGSSLQTPPYFSVNPPVYYGTRYARPYGISPFASPPVIGRPAGFQASPYPSFQSRPTNNPHISSGIGVSGGFAKKGEVQSNPFVTTMATEKIAKK